MQQFKKRIRLLTESLGGKISYGHDQSLGVSFGVNSARMTPTSSDEMDCSIDLGRGEFTISLPKSFAFDVVDRLSTRHLAESLIGYPKPPILQLADYISEEHGQPMLRTLRGEIEATPSLLHKCLGGNRILAEYYQNVLILRDDLAMAATNVLEIETVFESLDNARS
jgi:hypothetical protein